MMIAAVIVFVFEAILKWVSARGGLVAPSNVVPWVTVNSPWGVRKRTTTPGIRSSLAVVSTMVCSAALSIGLSADGRGLWHDQSPVREPSATPVIRATATTLMLVFTLYGVIFQFSLRPDAGSPNEENKGK